MKRPFTYLKPKSSEELDKVFIDMPTINLQLKLYNSIKNNDSIKLRRLIREELLRRKEPMISKEWNDNLILKKIPIRSKSTKIDMPKPKKKKETKINYRWEYNDNYNHIIRCPDNVDFDWIKNTFLERY